MSLGSFSSDNSRVQSVCPKMKGNPADRVGKLSRARSPHTTEVLECPRAHARHSPAGSLEVLSSSLAFSFCSVILKVLSKAPRTGPYSALP